MKARGNGLGEAPVMADSGKGGNPLAAAVNELNAQGHCSEPKARESAGHVAAKGFKPTGED